VTLTTVSVESAWSFRFKSFRHIKVENSLQKQPFGTIRQEGRRETAVFAGYFEKCDKFSYESIGGIRRSEVISPLLCITGITICGSKLS